MATSSDLMRATRRSGPLHFEQRSSNLKVLLSNSADGMYLDLPAGLSLSAGVGVGSAAAGTTSLREAACEGSTPKYLTVCLLGGGTSAARRATRASGSRSTDVVPCDHGFLKSNRTGLSSTSLSRSLARGGGGWGWSARERGATVRGTVPGGTVRGDGASVFWQLPQKVARRRPGATLAMEQAGGSRREGLPCCRESGRSPADHGQDLGRGDAGGRRRTDLAK